MITYLLRIPVFVKASRCKCGKIPVLFEVNGLNHGYGLECKACGRIHFMFPTIDEAIETWNKSMKG